MKIKIGIFLFVPIIALSSCSGKAMISFTSAGKTFETMYDDSYFLLDNGTYHEEISLASYATSMASIKTTGDYENRSSYLLDLWKKEGFSNFYISQNYKEEPGLDTIGFAIASKQINRENQSFNLIAIAVRSGGYGAEWASNFTVGKTGNSQGFDDASNKVFAGILQYLSNNSISGHTKFWLSGYSRGGATANMAAGKLLDTIEAGELNPSINSTYEDVYAYCFEPPAGAFISQGQAEKKLYQGVHNLLNFNDLIPLVVPYQWGFTRYGHDHYYPDRLTDIFFDKSERKKLISNYHFEAGGHEYTDYTVDDWNFIDPGSDYTEIANLPRESLHPSLGRFMHGLMNEIVKGIIDRNMYSDRLELGLRAMFATTEGLNPELGDKPIDMGSIVNTISQYPFIRVLLLEILEGNAASFVLDSKFLFYELFDYNEKNAKAVEDLYIMNFFTIYLFAQAFNTRKDLALQLFNRDNLLGLIQCHYTELNYSFTKSCDTRLYGKKACKLNDGSYRILHVKNPSSFTLYESQLKKNIFTFANGKMSSDCVSAERMANGDINIYLPNNGLYTYQGESESISLTKMTAKGVETGFLADMPLTGTL